MSKDYQEEFLLDQIEEYNQLLIDSAGKDATRAHRNIIKTLEKQKAAREARLKDLLAEDKKDDGLVFDELGVDHIFIDEAHYFKNLETPTKMERVAGIQTGGSERAFDIYMKARYLDKQHPGHGVTFATGTPISNTMVELYTMQRFLDPKGLSDRGIDHFDAWAATFGEVVESMEIAPDGKSLKPRSRFAKFTNLPELQQLFRAFADVQTADMLDLPRPKLETGKAMVVACPMSEYQQSLQKGLVARYERIRRDKVDPREDNALAITTDGRKLALDGRMLTGIAPDFAGSKINALVGKVVEIWERSAPARGTQMIFCDMGINPTPWGFSAYEEITRKLIDRGIPSEQIASIGDADSDAKKQALFDRVRSGQVRVLLGSTAKMGTGTNVQKRLVALHHLDAPWKPAEVEQREGRILRQGNENKEVAIYRYVTEGSFDAYMWQALETKARFISQVITGDNAARRAEDIGGQELSYAEVKAIASGNPAVLTLAEADAELQRLTLLKKQHADEQFLARRNVRVLPETTLRLTQRLANLTTDKETLAAHDGDRITIGSRTVTREDEVKALGGHLDTLPKMVMETRRFPLGIYRGLRFGLLGHAQFAPELYLEGSITRHESLSRDHHGPRAILNALESLAATYHSQCESARNELAIAEAQFRDYQARLGTAFTHESYLTELTSLRDQLKAGLSMTAPQPEGEQGPSVSELAERIKALKAGQNVEAVPVRSSKRTISAEEPVTARIRRKSQAITVPGPEAAPVHDASPAERSLPPELMDSLEAEIITPREVPGAQPAVTKLSQNSDCALPPGSLFFAGNQPTGGLMPRKKQVAAAEETPISEVASPTHTEAASGSEPAANSPSIDAPAPEQPSTTAAQSSHASETQESESKGTWVGTLPEPHGRHGINLGDGRIARLFLSRRFNQNMIQFVATAEGVDPRPSKKDTEFLKANGWRWRSEEKAWTRQLDKNTDENRFGRAKSDRAAEDQFVTLVNDIRARNGLEPTGYDFGQEASR